MSHSGIVSTSGIVVITVDLKHRSTVLLGVGEKHKTSVNIDGEVWNDWLHYVLDKTGSTRKVSAELEAALVDYMKNHKVEGRKSQK